MSALRHCRTGRSPPDVIAIVVLWRLRDKPSLHDLPEMLALRGIVFS